MTHSDSHQEYLWLVVSGLFSPCGLKCWMGPLPQFFWLVETSHHHPGGAVAHSLWCVYLLVVFSKVFLIFFFTFQGGEILYSFQTGCHKFVFPSHYKVLPTRLQFKFSIPLLFSRFFQFALLNEVRKFFLLSFYFWSPCFLSINSSVLILFSIGKVITWMFCSNHLSLSHICLCSHTSDSLYLPQTTQTEKLNLQGSTKGLGQIVLILPPTFKKYLKNSNNKID